MFRNPRYDEQAPPYAIDDGRQSGKNIEQRIYVFSDAAVSGSDILAWLDGPLYKVGNRCLDNPCPAACYKEHDASLHTAPHPLRSS